MGHSQKNSMETLTINWARKSEDIVPPFRKHETDAGFDIYSPVDIDVYPMWSSERIDLGVAFEIPKGYFGYVVERSSQAKLGVLTAGGVVDSGYSGWVHTTIVNNGRNTYNIRKGERICQIVFLPIPKVELNEVPEIAGGERGNAGHGSTGV